MGREEVKLQNVKKNWGGGGEGPGRLERSEGKSYSTSCGRP